MRRVSLGLWTTVLLGAGPAFPAPAASDLFDKPLSVRHVRLAPDPLNPHAKREVSCFTYAGFVVKQVDLGEVGADRLSIIPRGPGKAPACRRAKEKNEHVIAPEDWSGYFEGARSGYAFFSAPDGTNGGLGFMVFRVADRRKLFDDTAEKGLQGLETGNGTLKIRYQRVFASKCSVVTGGPACRDALVRESGIAGATLSSCAAQYQSGKEEMAKLRCSARPGADAGCVEKELKRLDEQKWNDAPTVIVYEVEASLDRASFTLKPLGDALACRPSD